MGAAPRKAGLLAAGGCATSPHRVQKRICGGVSPCPHPHSISGAQHSWAEPRRAYCTDALLPGRPGPAGMVGTARGDGRDSRGTVGKAGTAREKVGTVGTAEGDDRDSSGGWWGWRAETAGIVKGKGRGSGGGWDRGGNGRDGGGALSMVVVGTGGGGDRPDGEGEERQGSTY